jgi:uncharacterized delta-60 repeat protein
MASLVPGGNGDAVMIQPDGRIVVGGGAVNASDPEKFSFAILRLEADGTPDGTFGNGGVTVTPLFGRTTSAIYSLALQPDGKIVAGGPGASFNKLVVVRYRADGTLDPVFNHRGWAMKTRFVTAPFVGVQSDGKVVAAGRWSTRNEVRYGLGLARLTPEGRNDRGFGRAGALKRLDLASPLDAVLQPDDRLLVVSTTGGLSTSAGTSEIRRFLP